MMQAQTAKENRGHTLTLPTISNKFVAVALSDMVFVKSTQNRRGKKIQTPV